MEELQINKAGIKAGNRSRRVPARLISIAYRRLGWEGNGILLVEFTDHLIEQGMEVKEAIIEAGRIRMTPVILTASATILGLVPLAVGLNIDFVTMFTEFNPHLFFGGDSVAFWGPLSWTMIFGLGFATFLTLILVPAMYLISVKMKGRFGRFVKRVNE